MGRTCTRRISPATLFELVRLFMPPPPVEGPQSPTPTPSGSRPAQTQTRPGSSRPQSQPQSRPTQTQSQSPSQSLTTLPPSSSTPASQSLSTPPLPSAPPVETLSQSPSAQSTPSHSSFAAAGPTAVSAASSNTPVSTTTIAGAAAGGAVVVVALLGWYFYRRRQRKRASVPPPRPFSTWVNDRNTRGQTLYDASDADPYAMASLYRLPPSAAQSGSSSIKASPISETAPTNYLSLPAHGRTPTDLSNDSWIGAGTPSTATSTLPLISPASTDGADTHGPFAAALQHQPSRRSVSSSRDSPAPSLLSGSPAPTPPPGDMSHVSPFAGGSSRSPSIHSSSRSSMRRVSTAPPRPVSYAPSMAPSRHSIYSASASTIRGAPHQPHNRIDIVLPAPLQPETFVPVAPFMSSHSRTGSDRSRMSMGAMSTFTHGQAWRDDSPSREGSIADDVMSVRSQRSTATISASAQAPLYDPRYPQSLAALPPVPPLPASVTRSSSPASPAKESRSNTPRPNTSTTIASLTDALGLSGTVTPTSAGTRTPVLPSPSAASISTAEYSTPLGSPDMLDIRAPHAILPPRMSLEELAAAAVDTLLAGPPPQQQQRT